VEEHSACVRKCEVCQFNICLGAEQRLSDPGEVGKVGKEGGHCLGSSHKLIPCPCPGKHQMHFAVWKNKSKRGGVLQNLIGGEKNRTVPPGRQPRGPDPVNLKTMMITDWEKRKREGNTRAAVKMHHPSNSSHQGHVIEHRRVTDQLKESRNSTREKKSMKKRGTKERAKGLQR